MVSSEYIWDPLRRKSAVRQWFISVLHEGMKVPEHMMGSEVSLKVGQKDYRADIVVYDRRAHPVSLRVARMPSGSKCHPTGD